MAEKWMTDGYGAKAYVAADQVDDWKPRGWAEADGPAGNDRVWMRHTEHQGRAQFPAGALESWQALGWAPSDPPAPYDVTKDPQLVDVQPVDEPAPKKPTSRAAKATSENQE
jgi:hypothetical protein